MKMEKTAIVMAVICLLGVVSVYAAPQIKEKIEYATAEIVPGSLEVKHNRALRAIEKQMKKGEDVQPDVEAYAHFLADLFPSEEEIRYVDELIGKGYRTRNVVEIFEFWKDTQEDISIIEEVYAYRPVIDGVRYWVDEAFIQLSKAGKTKGKYEGLSVEEVQEYFNNGMSLEEIMTADKLSRHGTKGVKNIISDKQKDVSWFEIIDGVYNFTPSEKKNEFKEKYKEINNPNEIIASRKLAKENIMTIDEALDGVLKSESSSMHLAKKRNEKKFKIKETFKSQGMWVESEKSEKGKR